MTVTTTLVSSPGRRGVPHLAPIHGVGEVWGRFTIKAHTDHRFELLNWASTIGTGGALTATPKSVPEPTTLTLLLGGLGALGLAVRRRL